jgi:hypothetical protein
MTRIDGSLEVAEFLYVSLIQVEVARVRVNWRKFDGDCG